jgi:hypothetical protein
MSTLVSLILLSTGVFVVGMLIWRSSESLRHFLRQLFTTEYGMESLCGDGLPIMLAATNQLRVLSMQVLESGLVLAETGAKVVGGLFGVCGQNGSGGALLWDEIQLYQKKVTPNANSVTLGEPNARKSTGNKFKLFLGAIFGYNQLVMDRTGEYTPLVALLNKDMPGSARILRFLPDPETGAPPDVFINPMDPDMDLHEVRYPLITAMILIAMGKVKLGDKEEYLTRLNNEEDSLLWACIRSVEDDSIVWSKRPVYDEEGELVEEGIQKRDKDGNIIRHYIPLLKHLARKLRNPSGDVLSAMDVSDTEVRAMGYQMFLAVRKLTTGRLRGAFHEPTTPGILEGRRLLVLNCAGTKDDRIVLTTLLQTFYIQSQFEAGRKDPRKRIHRIELDEIWDMLAYPGMVAALRIAYKQSGKLGIAINSTMHHEQDAEVGTDITAIEGLFADSAIRWFYRMNRAQLEARAKLLRVNENEIDIIVNLKDGQALLKIGDQPGIIVEQRIWPEVLPACDTRWKMRRESDLPRAQELLELAA